MKKAGFFSLLFLLLTFNSKAQLDDLIIVEFVDWDGGSGVAIKVCNPTNASINLSNYWFRQFQNGATTPSGSQAPFQLSGTLLAGDCIIISDNDYNNTCSPPPNSIIMIPQGVNRDDAVAITFGNNNTNWVDMINAVGWNGTPTIQGINNATFERKIVRNSTNCYRYTNTTGSGPNSWPTNSSTNVTTWSVSSKANSTAQCLSTGPFTFMQPTKTENISECDSAFIDGIWQKTSGTFTEVVAATVGCLDTLKTIQLTINNSVTTQQQETICQGQSYLFDGQNLSVAGTYRDTLQKVQSSCDSIIVLTLFVTPSTQEFDTVRICSGSTYDFDGTTLSTTGDYQATFTSALGCDSVVDLRLIVNSIIQAFDTVRICDGADYLFDGNTISTTGDYQATYTTGSGCDSVVDLRLIVRPPDVTNTTQTICANESIFLEGALRNTAGTYTDVYTNQLGCDSTVITDLQVTPLPIDTIRLSRCQGQAITVNGNTYFSPTLVRDTLAVFPLCDTILIYKLSFDPPPTILINQQVCAGDQVNLQGTNYTITKDTSILVTQQQAGLCDTIFEYRYTIDPIDALFSVSINEFNVSFTNNSINSSSASWEFGDGASSTDQNPFYTYSDTGKYAIKLTVTNNEGCLDSAEQIIEIIKDTLELTFYVPNVFTPNGDGLNDNFEVSYQNFFEDFEIFIFNRWGEQVYQSNRLDFSWNGEYNGKALEAGSYAYFIRGLYERKGTVTILK